MLIAPQLNNIIGEATMAIDRAADTHNTTGNNFPHNVHKPPAMPPLNEGEQREIDDEIEQGMGEFS